MRPRTFDPAGSASMDFRRAMCCALRSTVDEYSAGVGQPDLKPTIGLLTSRLTQSSSARQLRESVKRARTVSFETEL